MNFNDFYWHDSVLKGIFVDRTNPGENDTIILHIDWYDKPQSSIVFRDVFQLNARMNFGIIAPESIDDGYMETDDCEDIKIFRKKWP